MERHIYGILFDHLAEQDLISGVQWGFCPGRSTVTAFVSAFHHIFQLLENGLDVPVSCMRSSFVYDLACRSISESHILHSKNKIVVLTNNLDTVVA